MALGTDDVIRRIILVADRFEILEDGRGGNERNVHFWTHHALEAIATVVPVQSVEL